ncbi:MAG: shikimate kinase [Actinomycetota bacterium]
MTDPHLVIMGPMGVGKSTLAHLVGDALGRPVRDSDRDIERLFGRTGGDIAAADGVDALHDLEAAVLLGALADSAPMVIGAAGWVVEDRRCREALGRRATVVVLDLATDALVERLRAADENHRRTIDRDEVEALAVRRRPAYQEVADLWLDAGCPAEDLATEVVAWARR